MAEYLLVKSYSHRIVENVQQMLQRSLAGSWLENHPDAVFQICDELLKNAIKSNYKFLLIWQLTRQRLLETSDAFNEDNVDEWLSEVFFSGENLLIEKQLDKIHDKSGVNVDVRQLLDLENQIIQRDGSIQSGGSDDAAALPELIVRDELLPLFNIKGLARRLQIYVHFKLDVSSDQVLITVSNDSPILESDVKRIHEIRRKFRRYREEGRQEEFFIESLDTSGGGHGLGYAIMDSILFDLNLNPETSLFIISASRTMVLLALPRSHPSSG